MLDLRQLRYFVAVAEDEHVGRAAERLHISQSPLSRQIAQLEERLELQLFERSQQRIRLTADGRTFLAEARALLTHANRLESLARRLGRGDEGGLCIGYLEYAMHSGVLPTALRELRGDRPAVHIALYNQQSDVQLEGLRQRSLDIALVCEPPAFDDPDLEATQVLNDPMLLALPAGHPLATAETITPADLASQQWIGVMHRENALRHDTFIAACAKAGFTPTIAMEATEPLAALGLVAAGLGLTTVQQSLDHQAPDGVVLRELPWFSYRTPLWAAWHRINLRPLVETFRRTLVRTATEGKPAFGD
ncbi:LysR family transcriptional regulator [Stenotrophomonas maltophilia]|uniref:LysR family transcriptional regulator n=1 Tax=Stenotrophomonas maltophilia TaxID=40324 RepID=UPI00046906D2|nr:LysR family transcriptional regulator [Stenotrophomonas maltophilia]OMP39594.1 LysR family transcriptional regulator [Stenotrophomonas sp. KAs 5-3]AIL08664.1 bacterial regulatory helix-turn-helix, lysR family protein [Stenotrophomonas maltophilia]OOD19520.1 LysR family transcriptional regulator [Stenotrophomonas maltophilia]QQA84240.1 LysR family transcriptional regulator [Stenotrophomonas maltophilia]WQE25455.1 LysR family transcriptional regulator [Stenotrophomonas maltophilia]